jgi:hypothetical protein
MRPAAVGEIIATRRLYLLDDKTREIRVLLGKPQQMPNSEDDGSVPQIIGIGRDAVRCAAGVDGLQAVTIALKMIGADLAAFNSEHGGRLRWLDDGDPTIGFPL